MLSCKVDENLEMRLVAERYADELVSVILENFDHISCWMPWLTKEYSKNSALEFIRLSLKQYAEKESPNLLIFRDGEIVGIIGFNNLDLIHEATEIGYWLAEDAQGDGIITKCLRRLVEYGFEERNLQRIVILCAVGNSKSRAIPEKLGFTNEGTARKAEKLHDEFVDLVVYSMLKDEWENI